MTTITLRHAAGALCLIALASACKSPVAAVTHRQANPSACQLVDSDFGPDGTDPVHFETVAQGLETPWGLAFLPGGDLLVTERPGRIRLIQAGALISQPVAQIGVTAQGEGGLLGIALDPGFATNSFFYVYETLTESGGLTNRVERFVLSADHRSAISDRVILDGIPAGNIHDGGRIHFGPDGMLYVSTGNAGNTALSQDAGSLAGKILRVTSDGAIPPDNPTPGSALFLNGVRNAHGFDWLDAKTLAIADNGPTGEYQGRTGGDELSIAHAGDNLGWPTVWKCETQSPLITPILAWTLAVPPGGLARFRGHSIPGWDGNLILPSLGAEHLHRIVLNSDQTVSKHEVYFRGSNGKGRLRDAEMSPSGELYVTTSNCDGRGICPNEKDLVLKLVAGAAPAASPSALASRSPQSISSTNGSELELALSGTLANADGTPVSQKPVTVRLTASGLGLFSDPSGRCVGDPHMQGVESFDLVTGDQGELDATLLTSDFSSRVDPSCTLRAGFPDLDSLTVEATTSADVSVCAGYCGKENPSSAASCVSRCLTGQRKLVATKIFSKSDLSATSVLKPALALSTLGPPLSPLHGPDLTIDAQAAEDTAAVTTETFQPSDCAVVEGCLSGAGTRKLLRFDGVIENLGDEDFVLGPPEGNPLFSYSACHQHYHLQDIMLYELLNSTTKKPVTVNGSAVIGRKQGFCMIDNEQAAGDAPGKFACEYQGISPGWADSYDHTLDCQWIDVTGVPPGNYTLRITVNPAGKYSESDPHNNSAEVPVNIP